MNKPPKGLSRRERQIMDIVYARGSVSAFDIQEALPDPPGYSTVRTLLRILETKGHLRHEKQGMSFIYHPTEPTHQAAHSALSQVVQTFFASNIERVVATLLSSKDIQLTPEELDRISTLVEQAKQGERVTEVAKEGEGPK
ncbi:MAG: putative transcriptional regulator [Chthonomonadales bacterium]|nr:putative transcriptional regulator [Chthonomonadales bacterium]